MAAKKRRARAAPAHRDTVVIGGSAGGLEALMKIVRGLPERLPAAVFVVLHIAPIADSALPNILRRSSKLEVRHAADGEAIRHGVVYVAPPDRHLILRDGRVHLTRGPRENRTRPAIDPLFRSAARAAGPRTIGVVVSGNLDDGTAGLAAIKRAGGVAVVQHPDDAAFRGMVDAASASVEIDHVARADEIGQLVAQLVHEEAPPIAALPPAYDEEAIVAFDPAAADQTARLNAPSDYACPDCNGVLFEVEDGNVTRFRCRVGHAYSAENLLEGQSEKIDEALWTAYRALREQAALARRAADRARTRGLAAALREHERAAADAEARAALLYEALLSGSVTAEARAGRQR